MLSDKTRGQTNGADRYQGMEPMIPNAMTRVTRPVMLSCKPITARLKHKSHVILSNAITDDGRLSALPKQPIFV